MSQFLIMGRKANDGRGRLGGRAKGTPNKTTTDLKQWLSGVLDDKRETFERDLELLEPTERVRILSGLFNYLIPKQQSLSIEQQIESETEVLTRALNEAHEEVVDKIAERILTLQETKQRRVSNGKGK